MCDSTQINIIFAILKYLGIDSLNKKIKIDMEIQINKLPLDIYQPPDDLKYTYANNL